MSVEITTTTPNPKTNADDIFASRVRSDRRSIATLLPYRSPILIGGIWNPRIPYLGVGLPTVPGAFPNFPSYIHSRERQSGRLDMGIRDWERKQEALRVLFNVNTDKELVGKLLPDTARFDFWDNLRKWYDSTPKSPESRRLLDRIVSELGCANMNAQRMIECSFDEFQLSLPSAQRDLLKVPRISPEELDHIIHRSHLLDFKNMKETWLRDGSIDQLYMYWNIDSSQSWKKVIRDGDYKTYSYCISSLSKLLLTPIWLDLQSEAKFDALVIFGAGTPEKELQIIERQLAIGSYSSDQPLRVILVDASIYMVTDTHDEVKNILRKKRISDKVDIISWLADFTRLAQSKNKINYKENQRTCFFILGGTIGNIDEARFLQSVHSVSKPGDVLVTSAEFIDFDHLKEYKNRLVVNYGASAVKDLVLGPARHLLDELGAPANSHERRNLVRPQISEGAQLLCPISGTIGVESRVEVGSHDLALSISKRYELSRYVEFFSSRGFLSVGEPIACDEFPLYKQLIFKRN